MIALDAVTHVCVCGSSWWNVAVTFEDYEVAAYLLDMTCMNCGSTAKAPTEVDRPIDDGWVTV